MSNDSTESPTTPGETHVYQCYCERQIIAVILGLTSITGVFGNTLILLSVGISRKLRTITNLFVVNLSFADLITCLVLPLNIFAILSDDGYRLPNSVCIFNAIMTIVCIGASVNTLVCIAINRMILITRSRALYQKVYTRWYIAIILLLVWVFPTVVAIIPVISSFATLGYDERYSTCLWISTADDPQSYLYSIVVAACFYPIQLAVTFYSYTAVFLHVRRSSRAVAESSNVPTVSNSIRAPSSTDDSGCQTTSANHPACAGTSTVSKSPAAGQRKPSSRKIAVTKNLFYVMCTFVLCLTPFALCLVMSNSKEMVPYAAAILTINSCINPIIYATKHPDFKKTFRAILCCKIDDIPEPIAAIRLI